MGVELAEDWINAVFWKDQPGRDAKGSLETSEAILRQL